MVRLSCKKVEDLREACGRTVDVLGIADSQGRLIVVMIHYHP